MAGTLQDSGSLSSGFPVITPTPEEPHTLGEFARTDMSLADGSGCRSPQCCCTQPEAGGVSICDQEPTTDSLRGALTSNQCVLRPARHHLFETAGGGMLLSGAVGTAAVPTLKQTPSWPEGTLPASRAWASQLLADDHRFFSCGVDGHKFFWPKTF